MVFDRGYTDYEWFAKRDEQGVFWVTRLKNNADYVVVEERQLSHRLIRRDEIIGLTALAKTDQELFLRRIVVWDKANHKELVLLSNVS